MAVSAKKECVGPSALPDLITLWGWVGNPGTFVILANRGVRGGSRISQTAPKSAEIPEGRRPDDFFSGSPALNFFLFRALPRGPQKRAPEAQKKPGPGPFYYTRRYPGALQKNARSCIENPVLNLFLSSAAPRGPAKKGFRDTVLSREHGAPGPSKKGPGDTALYRKTFQGPFCIQHDAPVPFEQKASGHRPE